MNYSDSESWFKHVQASPTTLDLLLVVLKRLQKTKKNIFVGELPWIAQMLKQNDLHTVTVTSWYPTIRLQITMGSTPWKPLRP